MAKRRRDDPEYAELPVNYEDISMAQFRIRSDVAKTPLVFSDILSELTGCEIHMKFDHQQYTGSFKERGALNALLLLSEEDKVTGVTAASAGNHALALAYHCKRLNIPCTVVMPLVAPITKVSKCRKLGANVTLFGSNIAEAKEEADRLREETKQVYINGYDNPDIIAGAGTLAVEVVEQLSDVDAFIIPVGGAGLIAGMALAAKSLRPNTLIYGAEPENCPSFTEASKVGHPVLVETQPTLADGLAVPMVGEQAFKIATKFVDKTCLVAEKHIALAVLRMLEMEKTVVEGGGVIGLAALLSNQLPELKGKKVVIPMCGGNIDIAVLGRVIEKGLAEDGRLVSFTVQISDRPGGLAQFTSHVAETGASVKDIFHERTFLDRGIGWVDVRCVCETIDSSHAKNLFETLQKHGYEIKMHSAIPNENCNHLKHL